MRGGVRQENDGLVEPTWRRVTLLFLTGLFEDLPEATLAAVVIAALVALVDVRSLVALYRTQTRGLGRVYLQAAVEDPSR